MMSSVYSDLFGMRQTGLRFFSVYGPWGRPDMAYWLFTDAILQGRPIQVFNQGQMQRDFTFVDDVVAGLLLVLDSGPGPERHRIYNIGNSRPVGLLDMIRVLESITGVEAKIDFVPLRAGEMPVTYADIGRIRTELGFQPRTRLEDGLRRFVDWFRAYHASAEPCALAGPADSGKAEIAGRRASRDDAPGTGEFEELAQKAQLASSWTRWWLRSHRF
jgi:UDP-glucuronate 4-epimerase